MTAEPIRLIPIHVQPIDPDFVEAEIVEDGTEKVVLILDEEHRIIEEVMAILAARCPELYQRQGTMVRVILPSVAGLIGQYAARIKEVTPAWLREQISRFIRFQTRGRDGLKNCLVPDWVCVLILGRNHYPELRPLLAVVETPVFLADGQVQAIAGYDAPAAVLLYPIRASHPQPASPTRADAVKAMEALMEVFADFPFAADPSPAAHLAAVMAWILTVVARYAIAGPVPFTLVDASSQASGKGLLVQVVSSITTGRPATPSACSGDQEELRRMLLPHLIAGNRIGWLDEIPSPFGGRAWNMLCTAWPNYSDRVIRTSSTTQVPALTCWVGSGNNIQLASDTARRALVIRLEPMDDRPEARTNFARPDLLAWVRENQPRLHAAALTILRAFDLEGRPRIIADPVGSYEGWDALVRQAVAWVTGEDPMAPRRVAADLVDHRRSAWDALARALWNIFGTKTFTARDALRDLTGPGMTEAAVAAVEELLSGKPVTARSFSVHVLSAHRGTVTSGLRLNVAKDHSNRGAQFQMQRIKDVQN